MACTASSLFFCLNTCGVGGAQQQAKAKPAPPVFKYDDSGRMKSSPERSSASKRANLPDTDAPDELLGLVSGMLSPGETLLSDSPVGPPPPESPPERPPTASAGAAEAPRAWQVGEKVEVKDEDDDEWGLGVVTSLDRDGAPRVTKDGYDKGYVWDLCRRVAGGSEPMPSSSFAAFW